MFCKKLIWLSLSLITLSIGSLVSADQIGRSRYQSRQDRVETIWNSQDDLARGGRLYDNWFAVVGITPPRQPHPAHPRRAKPIPAADTWRCSTCHGWDYQGGNGNRLSLRNMREAPVATIITILKNNRHGYAGKMLDRDLADLALFISKGQLNMNRYIDRQTGRVIGGSRVRGNAYYQALCSGCHGPQGLNGDRSLGEPARNRPWRTLHKILNGQPERNMPALRAFGVRVPPPWGSRKLMVPVDVLAYLQTLPEK